MHDSSLNLWTEGPTEFEIIYSVCCHNLKTKSLFCSSNSWIRNNNYNNNRQERKTKINTFRFLTENSHKIYKHNSKRGMRIHIYLIDLHGGQTPVWEDDSVRAVSLHDIPKVFWWIHHLPHSWSLLQAPVHTLKDFIHSQLEKWSSYFIVLLKIKARPVSLSSCAERFLCKTLKIYLIRMPLLFTKIIVCLCLFVCLLVCF